ncbi:MAG: hypothetical protein KGO92_08325 [Bacteroidota bacterium]|nr:hypothetical protein [Bacteroidota bacterium]
MKTIKKGMETPVYPKNSALQDPYRVLDELFDYAHLDELEILLWEWLKTSVCGNFNKELTRTERNSLLTLYEKLQQLLEASHLIHLQKQKEHKSKRTG